MSENKDTNSDDVVIPPEQWEKARPEKLPEPTYWPFFLAMGITFIFWGLLTIWIILVAGILIFIYSLIGWINAMRHE